MGGQTKLRTNLGPQKDRAAKACEADKKPAGHER